MQGDLLLFNVNFSDVRNSAQYVLANDINFSESGIIEPNICGGGMNSKSDKSGNGTAAKVDALTCGLVMPISTVDGCPAEHWSDVKAIITESIEGIADPKFTVKLVSDADDVGVIQKRIVQNVYSSDVVVCDVSGKNPNVMFELGMRLAFDKPTVIVKDDKTDYSFDTGIIEHVGYPRNLRFNRMVTFKSLLAEKVVGTYNAAKANTKSH
jgi:hypothetical protein